MLFQEWLCATPHPKLLIIDGWANLGSGGRLAYVSKCSSRFIYNPVSVWDAWTWLDVVTPSARSLEARMQDLSENKTTNISTLLLLHISCTPAFFDEDGEMKATDDG